MRLLTTASLLLATLTVVGCQASDSLVDPSDCEEGVCDVANNGGSPAVFRLGRHSDLPFYHTSFTCDDDPCTIRLHLFIEDPNRPDYEPTRGWLNDEEVSIDGIDPHGESFGRTINGVTWESWINKNEYDQDLVYEHTGPKGPYEILLQNTGGTNSLAVVTMVTEWGPATAE